jgi:hypothetical protein
MGPYLSTPDKTKHSNDGSGAKVKKIFLFHQEMGIHLELVLIQEPYKSYF